MQYSSRFPRSYTRLYDRLSHMFTLENHTVRPQSSLCIQYPCLPGRSVSVLMCECHTACLYMDCMHASMPTMQSAHLHARKPQTSYQSMLIFLCYLTTNIAPACPNPHADARGRPRRHRGPLGWVAGAAHAVTSAVGTAVMGGALMLGAAAVGGYVNTVRHTVHAALMMLTGCWCNISRHGNGMWHDKQCPIWPACLPGL